MKYAKFLVQVLMAMVLLGELQNFLELFQMVVSLKIKRCLKSPQ